ncbi:hypothetical protein [Geopseudomonas aromaticivorans]
MFGRHEDHPGHSALGCELQITVNRAPCSSSSNGYACSATGGHCMPGDNCAARRGEAVAEPVPAARVTKPVKLSIAQLALLMEEEGYFAEVYKPGQKLLKYGLIEAQPASYGRIKWAINEAGRAVLAREAKS